MATETPTPQASSKQLTHCPNCGAKIHRPELSICSYCATPLQIGGKAAVVDEATRNRLAKMSEHKDWATASQWTPPIEYEHEDVGLLLTKGRTYLWLAAPFLAVWVLRALMGAPATAGSILILAVALLSGGWGLASHLRGRALGAKLRSFELRRRPAMVIDRRSETGGATGEANFTVYYFTMVFEDGSEGEYRFPGKGTSFEPMASGTTGLAYTRRDRLLAFKPIRV